MTLYKYLLPLVSVAPYGGFTMTFTLPLARVRWHVVGDVEALKVDQTLVREGETIDKQTTMIPLAGEKATAPVVYIVKEGSEENGWRSGESVAFLETHISAVGPGGFKNHFCPPTYTVYSGKSRKTLLSDNNLKFGDYNVITQARAFGRWIGGYPLVEIDHARDVEESFVLINPFERPAVATIEASSLGANFKVKIPARSGRRIALGPRLGVEAQRWRGQIFVSGPNRLIVFDCKHSRAEPSDVGTLEHLDMFRGDLSTRPITREARLAVGKLIARLRHA